MKAYLDHLLARTILATLFAGAIALLGFLIGMRGAEFETAVIGAGLFILLAIVGFTVEWLVWDRHPNQPSDKSPKP